jgi:hypothetical protein
LVYPPPRSDVKVAYYCRLHALELGMTLERTHELDQLLGAIMGQLERDKPAAALGEDDATHLERFSMKIFAKADTLDRAGCTDAAKVAKMLYVPHLSLPRCGPQPSGLISG